MSTPLTVVLPHRLTKKEAARRMQSGLARIRPQISKWVSSIEDTWEGDRMTFRATAFLQTVTGRVEVGEDTVRIEVDLPWLLGRVSGKVREQIERRGTRLLRG